MVPGGGGWYRLEAGLSKDWAAPSSVLAHPDMKDNTPLLYTHSYTDITGHTPSISLTFSTDIGDREQRY